MSYSWQLNVLDGLDNLIHKDLIYDLSCEIVNWISLGLINQEAKARCL